MNLVGMYALIHRETWRYFRVIIQALITPWITAALYIFIFGSVVGSRIQSFDGVPYLHFVLPGILMLNVITAAFIQGSAGLYFHRFTKSIEEMLVAPLSYFEIMMSFVIVGVLRGILVGAGVYAIAIAFDAAKIFHLGWFVLYTVAVSIIFTLAGLLVGLWANNFEQLAVFNTFVILPLTFLGGVFNPIKLLPDAIEPFARLNPFFYFVDGLRYAMVGVRESSLAAGTLLMAMLIFGLAFLVWHLLRIGWKIRT